MPGGLSTGRPFNSSTPPAHKIEMPTTRLSLALQSRFLARIVLRHLLSQ